MSTVSRWVMAVIVGAIILGLIRNAAGTASILAVGGTEFQGIEGGLSGKGMTTTSKGTISTGGTTVRLG